MGRGFALAANVALEIIRDSARDAEALGYDSYWVNHPGDTDGLAALAAGANATRRLSLGVGVIPLHTRGPASIAQGVHDNGLPLDRLLLGVGSAGERALSRMREGVAALRAELTARIVVAALGPRMCRLAGEIADGVLFNWLTPEHARRSVEWVREGAATAGRQPPRTFAYVRVALGQAARQRLLREGTRYGGIAAYAAHFARMRVQPAETAVAADEAGAVGPALRRWDGAVDGVVLRAITATETAAEYEALLRAGRP